MLFIYVVYDKWINTNKKDYLLHAQNLYVRLLEYNIIAYTVQQVLELGMKMTFANVSGYPNPGLSNYLNSYRIILIITLNFFKNKLVLRVLFLESEFLFTVVLNKINYKISKQHPWNPSLTNQDQLSFVVGTSGGISTQSGPRL